MNSPIHPASRLRYYTCREEYYRDNEKFSLKIMASTNFFKPVDEKEWPKCVNEDVQLLKQRKNPYDRNREYKQNINDRSYKNDKHERHCWSIAFDIVAC